MAGDKIPNYTNASGEIIETGTADGVRRALADLAHRLAELETRPAVSLDAEAERRLARIETVAGTYFRNEFSDFDAAERGEPAKG